MSSRKTTNLGLHAWEPTDQFTREEFNENFAAIDENAGKVRKETDAQIAAAAATAASAAAEAKNAAAAAQSSADAAATAASNAQQTANTATQAAQTAQSTASGRARIATGSYYGTGTADITTEAKARTFNIGFAAKFFLLITNGDDISVDFSRYTYLEDQIPWIFAMRGTTKVYIITRDQKSYAYKHPVYFIWGDTTVKMYAMPLEVYGSGSVLTAEGCLNKSETLYRWIAIG